MTLFNCTLTPSHNLTLAQVEQLWTSVFEHSENSTFFTHWKWIESTLLLAPNIWWLQQCFYKGSLVGLAVWFERSATYLGFKRRQLWLHKTGYDQLDRVWIEYNNFVVDSRFDTSVVSEVMLAFLTQQKTVAFDELHIDMTTQVIDAVFDVAENNSLFLIQKKLASKGYRTSLYEPPDSWLSKNTRYQLKRSTQLLAEVGDIVLDCVTDKQVFLSEFANYHIKQWQDEKWGSAFTNQYFMSFHQELVSSDDVTMLAMRVGAQTVARGYFMTSGKQVLFYASTVQPDANPKIKVGYVFHQLAMNFFRQHGYEFYDFLAGDMQYKQSLSNSCYSMESFVIERKTIFSKSRQLARRLKGHLRKVYGR